MAYPQTEAEIIARIDTIDGLIQTYLASPAVFTEQMAGTIKISIPEYIRALREERKELRVQLENYPYMEESEAEGMEGI